MTMLDDTHAVEAALAILRASGIDISSPRDGDLDDLEQERFNAAVDSCRTYARALSTVTPAEAGGMVDAQTEARAIAQTSLWVPAKPEHAKIGWTYDFEQTERIARAAYDSTGYDATMEVVEFVMAEADRRHATALAAKDAELARRDMQLEASAKVALDLSAQLAEANKALATDDDARRSLKYWIDGTEIIEGCLKKARYAKPEEAPFGMDRAEAQIWHQAQESAYQHALEMMGVPTASGPMIRAAARRALEAQGGE